MPAFDPKWTLRTQQDRERANGTLSVGSGGEGKLSGEFGAANEGQ